MKLGHRSEDDWTNTSDVKLDQNDDSTNLETFFLHFENVSKYKGWDRHVRLRAFDSPASMVLWVVDSEASVEEHKTALRLYCGILIKWRAFMLLSRKDAIREGKHCRCCCKTLTV